MASSKDAAGAGAPLEAAELYQRALRAAESVFGSRNGEEALALMDLAEFYASHGSDEKLQECYRKVRQILERRSKELRGDDP